MLEKGCGINECATVFLPLLTIAINSMLVNSVFPSALKRSGVILIFQGGDRSAASNFHPISLLPIFNKILESVRLVDFWSAHKFSTVISSVY